MVVSDLGGFAVRNFVIGETIGKSFPLPQTDSLFLDTPAFQQPAEQ
jgi:hypothetical protein